MKTIIVLVIYLVRLVCVLKFDSCDNHSELHYYNQYNVCYSLSVYSTLTLYDDDIGSPQSLTLTTSDSSLVDNGWDNRASTATVSGGCQWILYDAADFEENVSSIIRPSVISPGSYPFSSIPTFGLANDVLSAVRSLPAEDIPAIVLFTNHFYFDQMQVLYSSHPDLALTNFDNMVSSFIITGGTWELYSEANYRGSRVTLGQGHYPTPYFLRPIANDDLTSIRLIVVGK